MKSEIPPIREYQFTPFQKQLLDVAENFQPGLRAELENNVSLLDLEVREKRRALIILVEKVYEGINLEDIAPEILSKAGVEKISETVYRIQIDSPKDIPLLPTEFVYAGGTARALLLRSLGIDETAYPRDFDILTSFPLDQNNNSPQTKEVAELVGHPDIDFQQMKSIEHYLSTRDFTINELYVSGNSLVATKQCILDTIRGIIRLTDYEYNAYVEEGFSDNKLILKMLRFYSDALSRGFEMNIEEPMQIEPYGLSLFWIAVNIDKAMGVGDKSLETLIITLKAEKVLPEHLLTTDDILHWIYKEMEPRGFYFRYVPKSVYKQEENLIHQDLQDEYDKRYA